MPRDPRLGGRAQSGLFSQGFISEFGDLEGHARIFYVAPPANNKGFAAHFPDLGASPLNDMGCRGQGAAEVFVVSECHYSEPGPFDARFKLLIYQ
jgi:hypothetical protein